jgi:hypothetical protein
MAHFHCRELNGSLYFPLVVFVDKNHGLRHINQIHFIHASAKRVKTGFVKSTTAAAAQNRDILRFLSSAVSCAVRLEPR